MRDTICPDLLLLLVIDELHDIIQEIHLGLVFVLLLGQHGVQEFQGDLVIICDLELLNRYVREDHRLLYQILLLNLKQDPLDNIKIFLGYLLPHKSLRNGVEVEEVDLLIAFSLDYIYQFRLCFLHILKLSVLCLLYPLQVSH